MPESLQNDIVEIFHYRLSNANGELIEDSHGGQPLPYIHGRGNIIPGLERYLEGKKIGDRFTAEIPPVDAYGEFNEEAFFQVHRKDFQRANLQN